MATPQTEIEATLTEFGKADPGKYLLVESEVGRFSEDAVRHAVAVHAASGLLVAVRHGLVDAADVEDAVNAYCNTINEAIETYRSAIGRTSRTVRYGEGAE